MTIPSKRDNIFSWLLTISAGVFISGLYLDGYSHTYYFYEIDSFFNPWHAVLYGGYALAGITLSVWFFLRKSMPEGHRLTYIGGVLFGIAGIFDMFWHELLGFEKDIEGLISPAHMLLAIGMGLVLTGGIRYWRAHHQAGAAYSYRASSFLLLSMLFFLMQLTFLTHYGFYTDILARGTLMPDRGYASFAQAISMSGVIMFSMYLTGILCSAIQRNRLPFGSITTILTLQITTLSLMRGGKDFIPAAIVGGLIGDVVLRYLENTRHYRLLPLVFLATLGSYYSLFIVTIFLHGGTWWSTHVWSGVPVLAAIAAYLTATVALQGGVIRTQDPAQTAA